MLILIDWTFFLTDSWRQRPETEIPCFEFPVEYKSETIHMHYADEIGWGMESGYFFSHDSIVLEEKKGSFILISQFCRSNSIWLISVVVHMDQTM